MNRADFMNQLERLLASISPTEREEAIQYYNDYFDDAGQENEQEVIEALGNPARVAENIKRDLLGNGYGEKPTRKAQASDRALMKYGQEEQEQGGAGTDSAQDSKEQKQAFGQSSGQTESTRQDWEPFQEYGRSGHSFSGDGDEYRWSHDTAGWFGEKPENSGKRKMPVWAVAALVTVLVLASPVLAGVALGAIGLVVGALGWWFGMIFGCGAAAICLLLAFLVLIITGILCCFANPWVGMAMIGGGLICGSFGLLFLMLTVAMAGIVTPAIFRGIAWVFRAIKGRRRKAVGA